jgi:hypothetical protein
MILHERDIIGRDIKLFKAIDNTNKKYYIGTPNGMYLVHYNNKGYYTNIGCLCGEYFEDTMDNVNIHIDDMNIHLTPGNLLVLPVNNIVIDLNKKIMYRTHVNRDVLDGYKLRKGYKPRKLIKIKNT